MKLHFYIARRFLRSFLMVLVMLSLIFVLLDMVEHIRRFDSASVGIFGLFRLTMLNMPSWIYRILPLIAILATLFMFLNLARSSEMVVTRAAGRSALLTLAAPALTVFVIGALALAVINPIAAATSKQYERLSARYGGTGTSAISISQDALWLRQGNVRGQTVIRAERAGFDGTELYRATFFAFDPDGAPLSRIEADSARLEPHRWALENAKVWTLVDASNPERAATEHRRFWITSNLTQEQIRDSFGNPSSIPIWDLPGFIAKLEQAGFSSRRHRVWLQMEIAMPLFLVAMVLIGASFTMRHTRFGHAGLMVLMALMLGFGIYFVRNFAQILGESGQIPVAVAVWTPPVAAVMLSLGILLHLEDG